MTIDNSKRRLRISIVIVGGLLALLIDIGLENERRALAQMALWTVLLFSFLALELHKSLKRLAQFWIAMCLSAVHLALLFVFRKHFPLANMLIGFVLMAIEAVLFVFLYARIGQSLDPSGPFGLTEVEKNRRKLKV